MDMKNIAAALLIVGTAIALPAHAQPDLDGIRPPLPGKLPAAAMPAARALPEAAVPKVTLRMAPDGKTFDVRNDGTEVLRLEQVVTYYRFPGIDGVERPACSRSQLQPGQTSVCALEPQRMECSSLAGIEVEMVLNGQRAQERIPFESRIRAIGHSPRIELDKPKSDGRADIRVVATGQYVRTGTVAIMKGLVTLNSLQRFPATFRLTQEANELQTTAHVASPVENQPVDRVCFHLQEITTDDSLMCGGVGALLYRNTDGGQIPVDPYYGNIFVHNQVCQ